jgi:hypothetical protein
LPNRIANGAAQQPGKNLAKTGLERQNVCCSEMLPLLLITAASAAEVPLASPWMDATLPVDKRVELILKQMTNAEKQAQTIHLTVRPAASSNCAAAAPSSPASLPGSWHVHRLDSRPAHLLTRLSGFLD